MGLLRDFGEDSPRVDPLRPAGSTIKCCPLNVSGLHGMTSDLLSGQKISLGGDTVGECRTQLFTVGRIPPHQTFVLPNSR